MEFQRWWVLKSKILGKNQHTPKIPKRVGHHLCTFPYDFLQLANEVYFIIINITLCIVEMTPLGTIEVLPQWSRYVGEVLTK